MRSLVVVLHSGAPSFCYYESAAGPGTAMSREVLVSALDFARRRQLALQIVAGAEGVPDEVRALLPEESVCYVSLAATALAPNDVPIIGLDDWRHLERLGPEHPIAILRVPRRGLSRWSELWLAIAGRVQRVVLVLDELDRFREGDLAEYRTSLEAAARHLEGEYFAGRMIELNVLSDRIVLGQAVECGAGVEHVTVDSTGALHICPGFARRGEPAIGHLPDEPDPPNQKLLLRERAAICRPCDAWHCRRCVELNQRATLEVNTPPWQMCRAAHLEREVTRQLVERLHARGSLFAAPPIGRLDYEDPFALLHAGRRPRPEPESVRRGAIARPTRLRALQVSGWPGDGQESSMHERKIVGRVTAEERDEIRELELRKAGLAELFMSLARLDSAALEASPFYDKLVRDMGEVTVRLQAWWNAKARLHGWERRVGGGWTIDLESCEVLLG